MPTTRRDFIRITAVSGTALLLGAGRARANETKPWRPNAWLRIDPDGGVTIIVGKQEMGQGVRTSLPMIVAEELDADWTNVRIEQASTGPEYTRLGTGGSGSVSSSWPVLRPAAATARAMLVAAAAAAWSVDYATLRTENGFVIGAGGRRASYGELATAASKLEVPKDVALKTGKDFRLVGKRTTALDTRDIVTGAAKYGFDTRVPEMKFASVLRCPVVGGSVAKFDASKAKGVRVVPISTGLAIVGDTTWAVLKARPLIDVTWNEGPHREFDSRKHIDALLAAAAQDGVPMRVDGDPAAAFAGAAKTLEATYVYPFYAHVPMEPMNCIAHVHDGKCDVWGPTQTPNSAQDAVAKKLGIAAENVKVHPTMMGGGFGRRLMNDFAIEAAELSKAIAAPVQIVWTREEDIVDSTLQHATVEAMRGALDAEGNIVAFSHKKVTRPVMTDRAPSADQMKDLSRFYRGRSWGVVDQPYAFPSLDTRYVAVESPVRYGPWRAVFAPSSAFARECFLDEIAHATGRDPLQVRLHLLRNDARAKRVLETVRDRAGWGKPLSKGRGRGVAYNVFDEETHVAYVVEVTADEKTWHIDRVVCAVDCGVVINPIGVEQQIEGGVIWALAQITSEITIKGGRIEQSSFADYPIPAIGDAPRVETHIVGSEARDPYGMGEPPVPPFVPAVLNALFQANGRRIRRLPYYSS